MIKRKVLPLKAVSASRAWGSVTEVKIANTRFGGSVIATMLKRYPELRGHSVSLKGWLFECGTLAVMAIPRQNNAMCYRLFGESSEEQLRSAGASLKRTATSASEIADLFYLEYKEQIDEQNDCIEQC